MTGPADHEQENGFARCMGGALPRRVPSQASRDVVTQCGQQNTISLQYGNMVTARAYLTKVWSVWREG
eukprot:3863717-Rhodomonas_salina.2